MQNPPQRRSLLGYLALRIIAPLSLPLLGLLITGVVVYQELVASLIFDRESELGELAVWDLRLELGEYSNELHYVASNPDLLSSSIDVANGLLHDSLTGFYNLYDGYTLLDVDGAVITFAPDELAHLISDGVTQGDLQIAPPPLDMAISNVLIDPVSGNSLIALGTPVRDASGNSVRFLLGYLFVPGSDMIEVLARLRVGGSGYGYLVDRDGRVIFHPDPDELGMDYSDRSYVEEVKAGGHGGTLWTSPTGDRWIVDFTPITEAGWGLVVKEPHDIAVAPAIFYGWLLIGLGVLVVLVVFSLLWTGVRRVAAPIEWLSEQTERLAAGEDVKYTYPGERHHRDRQSGTGVRAYGRADCRLPFESAPLHRNAAAISRR